MNIFQRKDRTQLIAEEKILHCIEFLAENTERGTEEEADRNCKNIKALAEAYAAINGWC